MTLREKPSPYPQYGKGIEAHNAKWPDPATTVLICEEIQLGSSPRQATEICGVSRSTYHKWKHVAEDEDHEHHDDCREFMDTIEAANKKKLSSVTKRMFAISEDPLHPYHGRACEFLLKHGDPETFGDKQKVELSGPNGSPLAHAMLSVSPADVLAERKRIAAEVAAQVTTSSLTENAEPEDE
jgi:hypothetical protein